MSSITSVFVGRPNDALLSEDFPLLEDEPHSAVAWSNNDPFMIDRSSLLDFSLDDLLDDFLEDDDDDDDDDESLFLLDFDDDDEDDLVVAVSTVSGDDDDDLIKGADA